MQAGFRVFHDNDRTGIGVEFQTAVGLEQCGKHTEDDQPHITLVGACHHAVNPFQRLPRPLVLDMVRMAALLQSAAECQTGRYIVCPPDLMTRLRRQRTLVEQGLAPLRGER